MKSMLITIAVLAVTVMPSYAADMGTPAEGTLGKQAMPHHGMKMTMMPQHLLVMAYHKNLLTFGYALDKVAHHGETVPVGFARTAVAEMRRSTDELEKARAEILHGATANESEHAGMQKMMTEHLVTVKTHLRELEAIVQKNPIPSGEVIKQLGDIVQECEGMDCEMTHGKGSHCREMHGQGMYGEKGMHGCQCQEMRHGKMMQDLTQKMKAFDAEMARQVANMNRAPKDQKLDLLADIVSQLVRQHAEMTAYMERMMHLHGQMQRPLGAPMPPPPTMKAPDGEDAKGDPDMDGAEGIDE